MTKPADSELSRKERQIMDIIYRLGEASVSDVTERMSDDTSYDSVRITLGILAKMTALIPYVIEREILSCFSFDD